MEQKMSRKTERKIGRCFLGLSSRNTTMLVAHERNKTLAIELET